MSLLNDSIVQALCRTFAHSLWQGLLLAILTGLVIQLTGKKTASFRYNLLSLLLLGFLITASLTFYNEMSYYKSFGVNGSGLSITKTSVDYTPEITAPFSEDSQIFLTGIQQSVNDFLHDNAALIVGIWLLIFCYKCVDTINGLKHVYRIRNHQVYYPSEEWENKVSFLQQLLKIPFKVRLLESRLVDIPAVTGFFKPIILVPIGMLSNLPQEQVEAILLHELAHIRRADYIVNLLQRLVETLFFFNPGVLWLSSLMRDERENCCDDIAVSVTRNKKEFVHALVSFQEYRQSAGSFSMGLSNRKSKLFNRSKRLLYGSNQTLGAIEKSVLSVCVILLVAISFAFNGKMIATDRIAEKPIKAITESVSQSAEKHYDMSYNFEKIQQGAFMRYARKAGEEIKPVLTEESVCKKIGEPEEPKCGTTTTTITTTSSTTAVTENEGIIRILKDSCTAWSRILSGSDSLRSSLMSCAKSAPTEGFIINYPQGFGETSCKQ